MTEMAKGGVIPDWVAIFGAPGIMMTGEDSVVIGVVAVWGGRREFCTSRYVIRQSEIPWNLQSLGTTGRRRGLFRAIAAHVIGC